MSLQFAFGIRLLSVANRAIQWNSNRKINEIRKYEDVYRHFDGIIKQNNHFACRHYEL